MPHVDLSMHATPAKADETLTIVLDENDPVLESIKRAMVAHRIEACDVLDGTGNLKKAVLQFPSGFPQHTLEVHDANILRATGFFKISFGDLFGHLHVTTRENPGQSGQLSQGIAGANLTLQFRIKQTR